MLRACASFMLSEIFFLHLRGGHICFEPGEIESHLARYLFEEVHRDGFSGAYLCSSLYTRECATLKSRL